MRAPRPATFMTADYIGAWTLTRSITDNDQGSAIACTGSATLGLPNPTIGYTEAVSFRLAGKPLRATRSYRFAFDNGAIVATFDDGLPFFTLRLMADGTGKALHPCGADLYALTLTLRGHATWQTRWDVTGTKHLTIVTEYTR
jgi:hypothetical protein